MGRAEAPHRVHNRRDHRGARVLPETAAGWWALGLTALGAVSWVVLPIITINFREKYPVTDTWLMPAIGTVLIDIAAIFNLLCVFLWRERSVLNIVSAVLTVVVALLITLIVIGEGLSGV